MTEKRRLIILKQTLIGLFKLIAPILWLPLAWIFYFIIFLLYHALPVFFTMVTFYLFQDTFIYLVQDFDPIFHRRACTYLIAFKLSCLFGLFLFTKKFKCHNWEFGLLKILWIHASKFFFDKKNKRFEEILSEEKNSSYLLKEKYAYLYFPIKRYPTFAPFIIMVVFIFVIFSFSYLLYHYYITPKICNPTVQNLSDIIYFCLDMEHLDFLLMMYVTFRFRIIRTLVYPFKEGLAITWESDLIRKDPWRNTLYWTTAHNLWFSLKCFMFNIDGFRWDILKILWRDKIYLHSPFWEPKLKLTKEDILLYEDHVFPTYDPLGIKMYFQRRYLETYKLYKKDIGLKRREKNKRKNKKRKD